MGGEKGRKTRRVTEGNGERERNMGREKTGSKKYGGEIKMRIVREREREKRKIGGSGKRGGGEEMRRGRGNRKTERKTELEKKTWVER